MEHEVLTAVAHEAGSQLSEFLKDWEVINASSSTCRQLNKVRKQEADAEQEA